MFVGSLGITLWRHPKPSAAAVAVAVFLLGVTPTMHDYWSLEAGPRTTEKNQFLKNVSMLGAALILLSRADGDADA